jgi:hypothetical protein
MENIELNTAAEEIAVEEDLLADIEVLSDVELAKVGGGQGIFFL